MAGKNAVKGGIAELLKRVPKEQLSKFQIFAALSKEYWSRMNKFPEKLPPIDWEYYRANVRTESLTMIDEFEQKYQELNTIFDDRVKLDTSKYYVQLEEQRKEVQEEVDAFVAESNKRIDAYLKEMERLCLMKPYSTMTIEEFINTRPECADLIPYARKPIFWPFDEEEQGSGPYKIRQKDGEGDGDNDGGDCVCPTIPAPPKAEAKGPPSSAPIEDAKSGSSEKRAPPAKSTQKVAQSDKETAKAASKSDSNDKGSSGKEPPKADKKPPSGKGENISKPPSKADSKSGSVSASGPGKSASKDDPCDLGSPGKSPPKDDPCHMRSAKQGTPAKKESNDDPCEVDSLKKETPTEAKKNLDPCGIIAKTSKIQKPAASQEKSTKCPEDGDKKGVHKTLTTKESQKMKEKSEGLKTKPGDGDCSPERDPKKSTTPAKSASKTAASKLNSCTEPASKETVVKEAEKPEPCAKVLGPKAEPDSSPGKKSDCSLKRPTSKEVTQSTSAGKPQPSAAVPKSAPCVKPPASKEAPQTASTAKAPPAGAVPKSAPCAKPPASKEAPQTASSAKPQPTQAVPKATPCAKPPASKQTPHSAPKTEKSHSSTAPCPPKTKAKTDSGDKATSTKSEPKPVTAAKPCPPKTDAKVDSGAKAIPPKQEPKPSSTVKPCPSKTKAKADSETKVSPKKEAAKHESTAKTCPQKTDSTASKSKLKPDSPTKSIPMSDSDGKCTSPATEIESQRDSDDDDCSEPEPTPSETKGKYICAELLAKSGKTTKEESESEKKVPCNFTNPCKINFGQMTIKKGKGKGKTKKLGGKNAPCPPFDNPACKGNTFFNPFARRKKEDKKEEKKAENDSEKCSNVDDDKKKKS